VAATWRPETKLVWVETPSNPLLSIADIAALSVVAHDHGGRCVVDNTFATPYLQRPLALGADAVVHSTTKYLGGHSDVVGGLVAVNDDAWAEELFFIRNATGAVSSPFSDFLVLRGLKTLAVRMEQHCRAAHDVAGFLLDHPRVREVRWPGLATHPGYEVAHRQMRDFGGMVSFVVTGGAEAAAEVVARTRLFTLAESLGAVESLIEQPSVMTHLSVAGSPLEVDPALIRLSVGLETTADLLADLDQSHAPGRVLIHPACRRRRRTVPKPSGRPNVGCWVSSGYWTPYWRSPASPRPGTMKPTSLRRSSMEAVTTWASG
jgi:cystathionine gamma-synthase